MSVPWAVHLRDGSDLASSPEEARSRLRAGNLPSVLLRGGTAPALIAGERQLSHDELADLAGRTAGGLGALGLARGERVAIFAERSLDWILGYLGLLRLGAIALPLNPDYTEREVEQILADARPAAVLCDPGRLELVRGLQDRMPWLRRVIDLSSMALAPAPPWPSDGPDDPALIMYTSGTTGRPRGVLLDHGNLLAQARGVVEAWRWTSADRLVHALPLFHIHGLAMGLTGTLVAGASLDLVQWSPAAVVQRLRAGGTMFFAVPAMYQRLCAHLEQEPADLSSVRLFVSGSAPLPPALFERCARLLGQSPLERYGLTEAGIIVSNPYDGPRRPGRVGHPLPGVEIGIGERGEILARGGQVFSGYLNPAPDASVQVVDGWLHTQDVGEIDEDGSLAISGRLRDLIISGGYNVHPREVELILEQHPGVREVAVAGVPSERWGEEVTAYVVGQGPLSEEELIEHCRAQLAAYKCPRRIRFIQAVPRNAMGKVMRSVLDSAPPA